MIWNRHPIVLKKDSKIIAAIPKHSQWDNDDTDATLCCDTRMKVKMQDYEWTHNPPEATRMRWE